MKNKYYRHFNFFDIDKEENFDKSRLTLLKNFKVQQQTKINTCGPCCALAVLNYYGDFRFSEMQLAKIMKTRPWPCGTELFDFIAGLKSVIDEKHQYQIISSIDFENERNKDGLIFPKFRNFKSFVLKYLKEGMPIIVENIDDGGHYKVLIVYDEDAKNPTEDMLIFADPSDCYDGNEDGYNYFPAEKFFYMWFDSECLNEENRIQPFVIIKKSN